MSAMVKAAAAAGARQASDSDSEVGSEDFLEDVQLGFIDYTDEDEECEVNELFNESNWREWDGGKIGGLPVWLDPEHVPPVEGLRCGCCNEPMAFLLQIYSPLDHPEGGSESQNTAFHRALYVFCCRKAKCIEAHTVDKPTIQCIRCQLSRQNDYYPFVNSISDEDNQVWVETRTKFSSKLCGICGLSAPFSCSQCHLARYCSKAHQKLDWSYTIRSSDGAPSKKGGHKFTCNRESYVCSTADNVAVRFPEFSVCIRNEVEEFEFMKEELREEDERFLALAGAEVANADVVETEEKDKGSTVTPSAETATATAATGPIEGEEQLVDSILSKTDEADISQRDLQLLSGRVDLKKYLAAKEAKTGGAALDASQGLDDHVYNKFQLHMKKSNNSQVLRYNRWPEHPVDGALRVSSSSYVLDGTEIAVPQSAAAVQPPRCKYCGCESKFECQILPQMIYYLRTEKHTTIGAAAAAPSAHEAREKWAQNSTGEDIDWGSIDIYTCSASCQSLSTYSGGDCENSSVLSSEGGEEPVYKHEVVMFQQPPPLQYK